MSLATHDDPPMPKAAPALTFPRLMQSIYTGAVFLVARNNAEYSAMCIHHGARKVPTSNPAPPQPAPEAIGHYVPVVSLENLQDYGNTVYLNNEG